MYDPDMNITARYPYVPSRTWDDTDRKWISTEQEDSKVSDIVEHVRRTLLSLNDRSSTVFVARAAIKATIEHLRDNISDEARNAGYTAAENGKYEEGIFVAMLSQALKEIEEG